MFLVNASTSRRLQYITFLPPITSLFPQIPHFSTTSRYSLAARSPRVKAAQRQQQQQQQSQTGRPNPQAIPPAFRPKSTQWPTQVLKEAALSGRLSMSAEVAEAVLDDFERLGGRSAGGNICSEHDIEPVDLTKLAKLLINYGGLADIKIIQELLFAASLLKDPSATLMISKIALKHNRAMPLAYLQHLKQMVAENNYAALYVQGQIYEAGKQDSLALEMYMKSLSSASEGYQGAEAFDIPLGEVWTGIYRLKSRKDKEGAHIAIKRAALEYDEPSAYYLLAKEFTSKSSSEYENYMLKAAASGEMRAADALGIFYLEQFQGIQLCSSKESLNNLVEKLAGESKDSGNASQAPLRALTKMKNYLELAREWFNVGAEAKIPSSQVHLAVILRHEGKSGEGLEWLERARDSKSWANTISWFEKRWESDSVDFAQINIENLRLRQDGADQGV